VPSNSTCDTLTPTEPQGSCLTATWMRTVGAHWLLVDVGHAAKLVALVPTASLTPMLLLVVVVVVPSASPAKWAIVRGHSG
jgi:hypothetical protein